MKQSKQQALMFLLGAVLVGGALGFTADRLIINDKLCASSNSSKDLRSLLADRLQLSPEQESRIDSILDERHRQTRLALEPVQAQLDSIKLHARAQMRLVLRNGQVSKFDALVQEFSDSTKRREKE
jgi:hypothetical protein